MPSNARGAAQQRHHDFKELENSFSINDLKGSCRRSVLFLTSM
jgi:hypothetical protein